MLLFLFCNAASNASGQCIGNFSITPNGTGGDTIKAIAPFDTSATAVYYWTIYSNSQVIFRDSNTLQTYFKFDTNGTYQVCMHIGDTAGACGFDSCVSVLVSDAVYHPMLETINIWHLIENGCAVAPSPGVSPRSSSCFSPYAPVIFTGSDTIVDSLHYLNLYSSDYTFNNRCLGGFLREDTLGRKIYFRDDPNDPEVLLYDFSMQVGDSVFLSLPVQFMVPDSGYWYLYYISTVNTPVGIRRVFTLHRNGLVLTWLEGVGSPVNPMYRFSGIGQTCGYFEACSAPYNLMVMDNGPTAVSCYSHGSIIYFDTCAFNAVKNFGGGNCSSQLYDSCDYGAICGAIHEIAALSSFDIFPNPATNEVAVELDVVQSNKFSIILHDLQGTQATAEKELGWLSDGKHNAIINLQGLSPGFYLVECRTGEGSVYKKLVVF